MNQPLNLIDFNFKEGFKDASAIKSTIYSLASLLVLFIIASILIYVSVKYLWPLIYKLIYRNYIVVTEENLVVIDIRIYKYKDERLVIENEDMDRFLMWEGKYLIAVPGDVLLGRKEVNTKTGKVRYYYNKTKVFDKTEKGE